MKVIIRTEGVNVFFSGNAVTALLNAINIKCLLFHKTLGKEQQMSGLQNRLQVWAAPKDCCRFNQYLPIFGINEIFSTESLFSHEEIQDLTLLVTAEKCHQFIA